MCTPESPRRAYHALEVTLTLSESHTDMHPLLCPPLSSASERRFSLAGCCYHGRWSVAGCCYSVCAGGRGDRMLSVAKRYQSPGSGWDSEAPVTSSPPQFFSSSHLLPILMPENIGYTNQEIALHHPTGSLGQTVGVGCLAKTKKFRMSKRKQETVWGREGEGGVSCDRRNE